MTRINCIPVQELTDKHLLAEYRELPRISGLVWNWWNKTRVQFFEDYVFAMPSVPDTYRLGEGHVRFFYDKGEFLRRRFEDEIVPEMQKRGLKVNFTKYRVHPDRCNKDWQPDEEAMTINRNRIRDRLNGKKEEKGS